MGLEHHMAVGAADSVLSIDALFQQKAERLPGYAELIAHPRTVLAQAPLRIGPNRRIGTVAAMGTLLTISTWLMASAIESDNRHIPRRRPPAAVIIPVLAVLAAGSYWLTGRFYRGGTCVLTEEGVEFSFHGKNVFCPWDAFAQDREPRILNRDRAFLPLRDESLVVQRRRRPLSENGSTAPQRYQEVARGRSIQTGQLWFSTKHPSGFVLKDLYRVKLPELAELLWRLALTVGPRPA
ncbi:MAG: hypothetical protein AB7K24_12255 [Gemmataceae bacterium]